MNKFFAAAEKAGDVSSDFKVAIGSVIVDSGRIISIGINTRRSHPLQHHYAHLVGRPEKIYLHAEMHAIVQAKSFRNLYRPEIYVFRKNRQGQLAMARPCPICMQAIKDCGITRIHYTTNDGFVTETLVK
jgi:deoxycytidylate deaminase